MKINPTLKTEVVKSRSRPYVLSIAGFDPSSGAGILADIKTFEQNKVYGLGVITTNTFQTEDTFSQITLLNQDDIIYQTKLIAQKYKPNYVKVGLIESLDLLDKIIDNLQRAVENVKIIWDPIIQSSTGFMFHDKMRNIKPILKRIHLITPNWDEVKLLAKENESEESARKLAKITNVFLKGGHNLDAPGRDFLFTKEGKIYPFRPKNKNVVTPKHGSGCIFSSALTANLALGYPIIKACLYAKEYTLRVLESNQGLLGYHKR